MKRIIVMVLKNIIFVPYYWIMLNWYAAHVDKYTEEQRYAMLKKIDHAANRGGNLHIDGHGVENRPQGKYRRKHYDQVLRSREYSVGEWFYVLSESSGII